MEVFKEIEVFIAPVNSSLSVEDTPSDWLDNLLRDKLQIQGISYEEDVRWSYVETCLNLLEKLKNHLDILASSSSCSQSSHDGVPVLRPDALSVSQQQNVAALLQLIVAIGIVPYLLPGVGLPAEKRSKFLQYLLGTEKEKDILEKYRRLVKVTTHLNGLTNNKNLSQVIITKQLGDMLASLIQLSYAPLKKPSSATNTANGNEDFVMTEEMYTELVRDQKHFRTMLEKFIQMVYPPQVVKYLLVLQSTGAGERVKPAPKSINKQRSPTPKWVQAACGSLLSERLTQKDGVLNILQGVLDLGGESTDPQKYHIIAQVISNPPSTGNYSDLETYFQLISPQILKLLSTDDRTESKVYHLIAAACARSLTERSLILTRRYILQPIMEPLLMICDPELVNIDSREVVSEDTLESCIKKLHLLFVIGNDPSLVFIGHLRPIILALLELHCRINFGVSHLNGFVESLVKAFISKSCLSLSMKTLRAFSFCESVPADQLRPVISSKYGFVPGDKGGTRIIQSGVPNEDEDDSEGKEDESFYVHDDVKSIVIVDLLLEAKDKSLAVEFYLSLLKDLTEMMCGDNPIDIEDQVCAVSEAGPSESTCERLLALERDLDNTMLRLRKHLMVVRLLGLMSEDDKLRESLTRYPDKLIEFLVLTFNRGAMLCKRARESSEDDQDYSCSSLEIQSLTTALSLMSQLLVQKNMRTTDWKALQATVDDLGELAKSHKDINVRQMSDKLRLVIATHGAVLRETEELKSRTEKINKLNEDMQQKMEEMKLFLKEESSKANAESERQDNLLDFDIALGYINDPEIPVQGHGLIMLTKLIKEKDVQTIENIEKVFKIFQDNIAHEDTYIYLQSILGLSECANFNPTLVVDRLTSEFALLDDKNFSGEKGIEVRTKIGEALVKTTKILGELTPAHKNKLINTFLSQAGHPDPLVRASSLSNLGEVCKNLRFSIGSFVVEMFEVINQTLQFDPNVEVRRAAVLVIALLLEGLGLDAFKVADTLLRDIWRTLTNIRNRETDDVLLVHVGKAIHEVDKIVKSLLQPDQTLKKTIYVLDEPPKPF